MYFIGWNELLFTTKGQRKSVMTDKGVLQKVSSRKKMMKENLWWRKNGQRKSVMTDRGVLQKATLRKTMIIEKRNSVTTYKVVIPSKSEFDEKGHQRKSVMTDKGSKKIGDDGQRGASKKISFRKKVTNENLWWRKKGQRKSVMTDKGVLQNVSFRKKVTKENLWFTLKFTLK